MPTLSVEVQQDVMDPPWEVKSRLLPAMKQIIESKDAYSDENSEAWQVLRDLLHAENGTLITTPQMLLECMNYVSFNEEMNRLGQL
jgi:hypothetical protein